MPIKKEKDEITNGVSKPAGDRFPNLHNWSINPVTAEYPDSGVLIPSGFQTGEDAPLNDTDKYILIKQSGVDPNEADPSDPIFKPEQNGTDTGINKKLSNAYQSRQDAIGKGLYQANVFNPYIHYEGGQEIAYQENYKAATTYLDPYSDYYVFQTSLSADTFAGNSPTPATTTPAPESSPGLN
jgi:hypothetical protein